MYAIYQVAHLHRNGGSLSSEYTPGISGEERARITALACSEAPDGRLRWTLRLLADKVVQLGICEHLSHVHAGDILKKTSCSLT